MQEHRFSFEELVVWQDSRTLVRSVYRLTESFPRQERFGLVSQINRAAVSVASNIAEGTGRTSLKDQGHFSQLAYSSLMELACQLILACDLEMAEEETVTELLQCIELLSRKVNALRNSQLNRIQR